jgi:hypothetical protein
MGHKYMAKRLLLRALGHYGLRPAVAGFKDFGQSCQEKKKNYFLFQ